VEQVDTLTHHLRTTIGVDAVPEPGGILPEPGDPKGWRPVVDGRHLDVLLSILALVPPATSPLGRLTLRVGAGFGVPVGIAKVVGLTTTRVLG
jgi:hypothetical protein